MMPSTHLAGFSDCTDLVRLSCDQTRRLTKGDENRGIGRMQAAAARRIEASEFVELEISETYQKPRQK